MSRTLLRKGRSALQRLLPGLDRKVWWPARGLFQPYNYTLPDRYPWLFEFAAANLAPEPHILSFGCSVGDEPFSLRRYFPAATIRGLDINPANIVRCRYRARAAHETRMTFDTAANTLAQSDTEFDAIFCLAVLCDGALTTSGARRSDPRLRFEQFESVVTDFARCLKPGGLLLLHTTNFRFCDTRIAHAFDTVLQAEPDCMASDVHFDRNNDLIPGDRYRAVGFRKR